MAVTALRGYDPTTLAWKETSTPVPENSVLPTDIVNEGLFTVVALRKRRQQSKATKCSATNSRAGIMAVAARRSSGQRPRHLASCQKDVSRELPTKPRRTLLLEGPVNKHHLHLRHRHSKRHPRHLTRVLPRSNLRTFHL
ncbi:hypothetical protein MRX96_032259 [Rhipicephalus microplus]